MEQWMLQHRPFIITMIILASITLRAVYFFQISDTPCIWLHRNRETDMGFFDHWAKQINNGDWLTSQATHPYHEWHKSLAKAHFKAHPEKLPLIKTGSHDEQGINLWNQWYGGNRFHQEPLYSYILAVSYRIFGPDIRIILAFQTIIGVISIILIYMIALRLFGDIAAVASAIIAVLSPNILFYEMVLLRASFITFFSLALIYTFMIAIKKPNIKYWIIAGITSGLAILLKTTFIAFSMCAIIIHTIINRKNPAILRISIPTFICTILLCIAPVILRNIHVGASPLSFTSVNAVTFITSNASDYDPDSGFYISTHTPRIMGNTNGRLFPVVLETLKTHSGIYSYLKQVAGKFASMLHWYEKPNNVNFYYYRLHAKILAMLPFSFPIIAALAILGIAMSLSRIQKYWPLFLMFAALSAVMITGYVISRFRLPLLAVLIPFAGFSFAKFLSLLFKEKSYSTIPYIFALAAILICIMRPISSSRSIIRATDYGSAYQTYYSPLTMQAISEDRWEDAAKILQASLTIEPELTRNSQNRHNTHSQEELAIINIFSQVYLQSARVLQNTENKELARKHHYRSMILSQANSIMPK